MTELISTAPLYAKERVHQTNVGNILCTGRGCIGCDRKHQKDDEDFREVLGDVDSVDFSLQETRFLQSVVVPPRPVTSLSCHSNRKSVRSEGAKGKTMKKILKKKKEVVEGPVNGLWPKDNESKGLIKLQLDKGVKKTSVVNKKYGENHERRRTKTLQPKFETTGKDKRVSFAPVLVRETPFTVERGIDNSATNKPCLIKKSEEQLREPKQFSVRVNPLHKRSKSYPMVSPPRTNFLEMLYASNIGIFDVQSMRGKESSTWVEKVLKAGATVEQIFPKKQKKLSKTNNASSITTYENRGKYAHDDKRQKFKPLPGISLSERGDTSVLVFEHSHKPGNAKDESLHKLGFSVQQSERKKSFPRLSALEIAESINDFVTLGSVKLIQEHDDLWCILVSGRVVRDFLIQNGVSLRGRSFELVDLTAK